MEKGIDWATLLITGITILTGTGGVKLFQRFMDSKDRGKDRGHADSIAFRKSLLKRIEDLEDEEEEKDKRIEQLTEENFALKIELTKIKK